MHEGGRRLLETTCMAVRQVQEALLRQVSQEDGRKVVQEARVPRVHHRDEERIARVPRAERAADEALVF